MLDWTDVSTLGVHLSKANFEINQLQFPVKLLRLHAVAALPLVGTANFFTDMRKCISARQEMRDWSGDSTLSVDMSRANFQKN